MPFPRLRHMDASWNSLEQLPDAFHLCTSLETLELGSVKQHEHTHRAHTMQPVWFLRLAFGRHALTPCPHCCMCVCVSTLLTSPCWTSRTTTQPQRLDVAVHIQPHLRGGGAGAEDCGGGLGGAQGAQYRPGVCPHSVRPLLLLCMLLSPTRGASRVAT